MPPSPEPHVEWNRVTWYSKLLAMFLFIVLICAAFVFGTWYEQQPNALQLSNLFQIKQSTNPEDVKLAPTSTPVVVNNPDGSKSVTTIEDVNGYYAPNSDRKIVFFACSTPIPAKVTRIIFTSPQSEATPEEVPDMQPLDPQQAANCKATIQSQPDTTKQIIPKEKETPNQMASSTTGCINPIIAKYDLEPGGSLSMAISKCPEINQMVLSATNYLKARLGSDYVDANLHYDSRWTQYDYFMWHNYNTKAYLLGKLLLAPRLVYFDDSRLNALDPGAKSSDPNRTGYTIAVLIGDDHKSASDVFTLSNGMYGGSWYDGIQLPVHELPDCVRDANLCSSKVSHADAVAIAAANGLKISESSASFTIDFASSSGNGWAWFVQSTDETPTTECKQGTVSTMEINITTSKTSSVKSVCYFRPIPLENDGKVTVLQKPEVQTLIGKYNVGEVQLKALKFSYIQDKGFMERLLPIFKGKDIGCIIILKTPEVSKVYVEDENLQTFEELDYQTFNQYLNKASTADRQLFLDNLH